VKDWKRRNPERVRGYKRNSAGQRTFAVRNLDLDPEMSFEEIGRRLGISRKNAFAAYTRGMRKIAERKRALMEIGGLVELRRNLRESSVYGILRAGD
jgi:hypothetical protein